MSVFSYIQSASANASSLAFPSNVTAGSLLVLLYGEWQTTPASGVTDTLGNTWYELITTPPYGTGSDVARMFVAISGSSGANTAAITGGGSSVDYGIIIAEYGITSGTTYALAALPTSVATAGNSISIKSFISGFGGLWASSSTELLFVTGAFDQHTNHSWSSSGATIRQTLNTSGAEAVVLGDQDMTAALISSSPYSQAYSWTGAATNGVGACGLVALALSSSGGGGGGGAFTFG